MDKKQLYKIKPVYQQTIWGGNTIKSYYHIENDMENIGQIYHVIALENHLDNVVEGTNETLSSFYQTHKDLFDCSCPVFPIRMATSCSEGKMSYHLHPNNEYAWKNEKCLGKVSGSISYEPTSEENVNFMGTTAKSIEEFKQMVEDKKWDEMRDFVTVRDDQYFHTPAGIIHGGGGSGKMKIVFATNSDISYRLYDYDRNDPNRTLHIQQVYDCIEFPKEKVKPIDVICKEENGLKCYDYYDGINEYIAKRYDSINQGYMEHEEFYFLLVVKGEGKIGDASVKPLDCYLVPAHYGKLKVEGNMQMYMVSYREK